MPVTKEIAFSPTPKQMELIKAVLSGVYRYILFGGSVGGGKSFAALGVILMLCKMFPGSKWVVVRDTMPTLQRTTIPTFVKICPPHFIKKYNQDLQVVTFTNGSEIMFLAENYETDKELLRFRGLEANGFILEECNELQEATYHKCIERAGRHIPANGKKPLPVIILTCNPSPGWVKDTFYTPWKNGNLPDDHLFIPSRITDNPHICNDEVYMKSLDNLPNYQKEVMINGNWEYEAKADGAFYKCFIDDTHTEKCQYDPLAPLHLSFDENSNPYLYVGIYQIVQETDQDGRKTGIEQVLQIDEFAGVNPLNTVEAVCKEIYRRYCGHVSGMFIYGDATSQKQDTKIQKGHNFFTLILGYLNCFKPSLRVSKSNPSVSMRGNFINSVLEKETEGLRIRIGENCKICISDLNGVKEAADGSKDKSTFTDPKTKVRAQKFGHASDCLDYFITQAFSGKFAQYQRGGRAFNITLGRNASKFAEGYKMGSNGQPNYSRSSKYSY